MLMRRVSFTAGDLAFDQTERTGEAAYFLELGFVRAAGAEALLEPPLEL